MPAGPWSSWPRRISTARQIICRQRQGSPAPRSGARSQPRVDLPAELAALFAGHAGELAVALDHHRVLVEDVDLRQVVGLAQQGDSVAVEYLLSKYKNFVRSKARSYFLIGADHEDIVQEGMIGLFKAIRDYQAERLSSFRAFAELCITRQIITAIKTATRQKHVPLNSYVSLNKPIYDEESDRTLMDVIVEGRAQNPEELIIGRENLVSFRDQVDRVLSGLEQDVLNAYLDGKSYQEIADKLGISKNGVRWNLDDMVEKGGFESRESLVATAIENKLMVVTLKDK